MLTGAMIDSISQITLLSFGGSKPDKELLQLVVFCNSKTVSTYVVGFPPYALLITNVSQFITLHSCHNVWGVGAVSLTIHLVFGLESGGLITFFSVNKHDAFIHMASNWPTERIPMRMV